MSNMWYCTIMQRQKNWIFSGEQVLNNPKFPDEKKTCFQFFWPSKKCVNWICSKLNFLSTVTTNYILNTTNNDKYLDTLSNIYTGSKFELEFEFLRDCLKKVGHILNGSGSFWKVCKQSGNFKERNKWLFENVPDNFSFFFFFWNKRNFKMGL